MNDLPAPPGPASPPPDPQAIRAIVRDEVASMMAAALADPQVDDEAKSLAGYLLDYTTAPRKEHDRAR